MVDLVVKLNTIDGVAQVDVTLQELEKNVEELKVTLQGYGFQYDKIREIIRDFGAVIRNVDSITTAKHHNPDRDDALSASMLVLARHIDSKVARIDQIHSEFKETLKHVRSERR